MKPLSLEWVAKAIRAGRSILSTLSVWSGDGDTWGGYWGFKLPLRKPSRWIASNASERCAAPEEAGESGVARRQPRGEGPDEIIHHRLMGVD